MIRTPLAALMAIMLVAWASPARSQLAPGPADAWAALHPWDHSRPGVEKLDGGVEYLPIVAGDAEGAPPKARDRVAVRYEGRFAKSGLIFDSSGDETATFPVDAVIPGFRAALLQMRPGDTSMVWIPSDQAYGERGVGYQIPPYTDLMFHVTLVRVWPDPWPGVLPWPTGAPDIVRLPSGLEYRKIDTGPLEGALPTDADIVTVHFEGRLDDPKFRVGATLDEQLEASLVVSTQEEGRPLMFPVADLTAGWNEVVKLMRPGDRWIARMPPHLLYGEEGDGPVPPGGAVIYDIELLDIAPAQ